jgi:ABC-type multidrug transport system fused ATPase/permease subunit
LLIAGTIATAIITFFIESVVIPRILGDAFNNISESSLRYHLLLLVGSWIFYKIFSSLNDSFNLSLETNLGIHLHETLYHQLFLTYEQNHTPLQTALLLSKFHLIQETIESILYRIIINIIPRLLSVFLILANIFTIQPQFGYFCSFILFVITVIMVSILNSSDITSSDELSSHDSFVEQVDDVFTNMETVHSTVQGKEKEENELHEKSSRYQHLRKKNGTKMIVLQNIIYAFNIVLFSLLFYYIFVLYKKGELPATSISPLILSILPLFNTLSELMYYVPDIVKKWNIL